MQNTCKKIDIDNFSIVYNYNDNNLQKRIFVIITEIIEFLPKA